MAAAVALSSVFAVPAPSAGQQPLFGGSGGASAGSGYSPAVAERIRETHVAHPWSRSSDGRLQRQAPSGTVVRPAGRVEPVKSNRPANAVRPAAHKQAAARGAPQGSSGSQTVRQTSADEAVEVYEDEGTYAMEMHDGPMMGMPSSGSCGGPACGGCSQCNVCLPCLPIHNRLWVRGEYLLWWTKGNPLPPLVTTSPTGTLRDQAGVLGQPGTQVLFGGHDLSDDSRSGGRATLGYWLDDCHCWGLEVSYLGLDDESADFSASSLGSPILARPFLNVQTNLQDSELVAFPNVINGRVSVVGAGQFESLEVLGRRLLFSDCCGRLDFLLGYRWARLDDQLQITENLTTLDVQSGIQPGTRIDVFDSFSTTNDFHGVQLGVQGQWRRGNITWDLLMKLGLGNTRSRTQIAGSTTSVTPGGLTATNRGGLLAQDTNIGIYESNEFAVLPELGIKMNYDFCCNWRASVGYSFLYWSSVMRSGEQIDTGLNLSQLPPGPLTGSPQPRYLGTTTDFWAQGLTFGLEYRF